ncbi:MAG: 50S ribosomal protein L28 [Enterobacterales bacterium]
MSKICKITGKRPLRGNKRSHSMRATKRWFSPNLHYHRFWISKENRFIKLLVSSKGIRIIDKIGIEKVLSNKLNYQKIIK